MIKGKGKTTASILKKMIMEVITSNNEVNGGSNAITYMKILL
jgi:hypothetical protein